MRVEMLPQIGNWMDVANAARTTAGSPRIDHDPSEKWIDSMIRAEHSPIRLVQYHWIWHDLPYWVSVHFTRHKVGIEHFVRSQRGQDRHELRQDALVEHECVANVQAIINISRKRLCAKAALETREAWDAVVEALPASYMWRHCMAECKYRGFCPEREPCGRRVV